MPDSSQSPLPSQHTLEHSTKGVSSSLLVAEVAILLLGVWAYWPALLKIFHAWNSNPDYSHGFLVLPIAMGLLWARRDSRPRAKPSLRGNGSSLCWTGFVLLVLAGFLRFAAGRLYLPELDGWSIPVWLGGMVLLFHGPSYFRWALPSLAFLWFATPLPASFEIFLSTPLQQLAAQLGSWSLRLVGEPAIAEGTTILLGEQILDIERACSGLRMFYGIFALAVACVVLARLRGWTALTVLFAAIPVALLANVCRIAVTGILLQSVSGEAARKFSHDFAGLVMIPLAVLLFGLLLWWLHSVNNRFRSTRAEGVSWLLQWGICALLLVGALFWWGNRQQQHAFRALLDLASQHESQQNWRQASVYLQRYVQANPADHEALGRFATAFAKTATRRQEKLRSISLSRKAWRQDPSRQDLAFAAAQTAFEIREYRKAIQICEALLAADDTQNRDALTLLHADALLQHMDGAATIKYSWQALASELESTRNIETDKLYYEIELAKIWQEQLIKPDEPTRAKYAREIMNGLVAKHPDNPLAWLARHQFAVDYGSPTDQATQQLANQDLQQALSLAEQANSKEKTALYLAAAAHRQRADESAAAEEYLLLAMAATPNDPRPYVALAELKRSTGDPQARQEAIALLQAGLKFVDRRELNLLLPLASLQVEAQDWDAAKKSIAPVEALVDTLTGHRQTKLKLGIGLVRSQILWQQRGVYAALGALEPVVNDEGTRLHRERFPQLLASTHVLLGKLYSAVAIYDRASEQYRLAVQLNPETKSTRINAAESALRAGDLESAELHCRRLLKDDPTLDKALLAMIRIQLRRQLRQAPDSRGWDAAKRAFAKARDRGVSTAKLLPVELELLLAQGELAAAEEFLLRAIEQAPEEPLLWRELTALLDHRGQSERALEAADRYLERAPEAIRPYVLKAMLLEKTNRSQEAQDLLSNLLQHSTGRRWLVAAQELAKLQLLLGNVDQATTLLETAHQKEPADLNVLSTLASLAWVSADWELSKQYESSLREVEGEAGTLWRFHRAQRLLANAVSTEDPKFVEVRRLSQAIQNRRPRWSKASHLLGDIALRSGQVDVAIAAFQQAWNLGDRSALLADRLIELLTQQARFGEAQGYVSQVRSALPLSSRLFERAIPYYVEAGEPTGALTLAEAWVARQPKDAAAHLRLGRVLLILPTTGEQTSGEFLRRAEAAFLQALHLAPTDVGVWVANVMLVRQKSETEVPLEQILDQLNRQVDLEAYLRAAVLAELHEVFSRPLVAQQHYRQAIALAAQQEGTTAEVEALSRAAQFYVERVPFLAEQYSRRALAIDPDADLARQVLLQILVARDETDGVDEALALLDYDPTRERTEAEVDLERRIRAQLLQRQGQPAQLSTAINLLETLLQQTTADKRLLAALYERTERIGPAFGLLSELVNSTAARPEDQAAFLQFWQRHFLTTAENPQRPDFAAQAEQTYDRLRQTPQHQAEWLRWKLRAAKLVRNDQQIPGPDVQPLMADLLETNQNLAHWSDAAKLTWCRSLLQVLIEEDSASAAIKFVKQPPTEVQPTAAAIALCHAMILTSATSEVWPEVNDCLRDLQTKYPQRGNLARAVGDYQFMTGQYVPATVAYRAALAIDPNDHLSRNNLALTLAEQPGRLAEAQVVLNTALAEDGSDPALLDTLAVLELIDQRADQALVRLEQVLAASPENATAKIHAAMGHQALGDEASMRAALLDALGLGVNPKLLSPRDRAFFAELSEQVFVQPPAAATTVPPEPKIRVNDSLLLSY